MLGDVIAHTFGLRGQEYTEAEWDSWKGEDGSWVVALSWRAGRSDNRAHWTFHPGAHGGTVTALDEHASDLVEGLPARPLRTVGPVIDIARPEEPAPAGPPPEELRAAASDTTRGGDRIDAMRAAGMRVDAGRQPASRPARGPRRRASGRASRAPMPAPSSAAPTAPRSAARSRPHRRRAGAGGRADPAALRTRHSTGGGPTPEPASTGDTGTAGEPAHRPQGQAGDAVVGRGLLGVRAAALTPAPRPAAAVRQPPHQQGKPVMPSWDEVRSAPRPALRRQALSRAAQQQHHPRHEPGRPRYPAPASARTAPAAAGRATARGPARPAGSPAPRAARTPRRRPGERDVADRHQHRGEGGHREPGRPRACPPAVRSGPVGSAARTADRLGGPVVGSMNSTGRPSTSAIRAASSRPRRRTASRSCGPPERDTASARASHSRSACRSAAGSGGSPGCRSSSTIRPPRIARRRVAPLSLRTAQPRGTRRPPPWPR